MEKKKNFLILILIIMFLLFLIGIILILSSVSIGKDVATTMLMQDGGFRSYTTDPNTLRIVVVNCQIVGSILSVFGGAGIILSGYELYKKF